MTFFGLVRRKLDPIAATGGGERGGSGNHIPAQVAGLGRLGGANGAAVENDRRDSGPSPCRHLRDRTDLLARRRLLQERRQLFNSSTFLPPAHLN